MGEKPMLICSINNNVFNWYCKYIYSDADTILPAWSFNASSVEYFYMGIG